MPDEIELDENSSSPKWPTVREGINGLAVARIGLRYEAVDEGTRDFADRAKALIEEKIKKAPGKIPVFGFIVEQAFTIGKLVVPEAGLAAEIFEVAETAFSSLQQDKELADKASEEVVAHTIEAAIKQLTSVYEVYAKNARGNAYAIQQSVVEHLGSALDRYIDNHPQPLQETDDFYHRFCDGLGLPSPDRSTVIAETMNKIWPDFEAKVQETADSIHFFHEMEDDVGRLEFLIDMESEGHNPEEFLRDVGADLDYWNKWLAVYHSSGKEAALDDISYHVGGRRTREIPGKI
jgi:hypothetical protein